MNSQYRYLLTSVLLTMILTSVAAAQSGQIELKLGEVIKNEISPGEKHRFRVRVAKNRVAFFKLEQIGVDVSLTTYNFNGSKLEEFDRPNGRRGLEFASIVSSQRGEYSIEIRALGNKGPTGKYTLILESVEKAPKTPAGKVDQLFRPWNNSDSPGAAVAIVKDGKIAYSKGYGMANLEYDIPITPDTIFHIASVSKQFATFSILLLEKEGKLSLDDDIRKYIPEVPNFGKKITLRQLGHHTSGLRDQWNLLALAGWRLDDVITKEHILKLISKQKELNFDPGAEYSYSNTGYTLLAEVVARVSGKSFPEFTDERIFKPLGMKNTLFYDDHEKIVKNRAYSYRPSGGGFKKSVLSYANVGATSLFTTVNDLSKWALNFETPQVGDKTILAKLKTKGVLNSGRKIGYALGQSVGKYRGLNRISHSGGDAGYRTYLGRFPDQKFSVVVFSNDGAFSAGRLAQKVTDIYLKDQFVKKSKAKPVKKAPVSKSIVKTSRKKLASYVGQYELSPSFIITVSTKDGSLFGRATGQGEFRLKDAGEDRFKVEGIDAEVSFKRNEDGKVNLLKLNQAGRVQDAPRIKPFDPKKVKLEEYTGEFFSEELLTTYFVRVIDGKIIAQHQRNTDIEFTPTKKDRFLGNSWFLRAIEYNRDAKGSVVGMVVSSGRVRNVRFKKVR